MIYCLIPICLILFFKYKMLQHENEILKKNFNILKDAYKNLRETEE